MPESTDKQLEQKRFVVSPDSISGMKKLRETLTELQEEYPYLSGLGFFGSRTKGKEHPGSDYDICLFYNMDTLAKNLGTGRPIIREAWTRIREELSGQLGAKLDKNFLDFRVNIGKSSVYDRVRLFIETAAQFEKTYDIETVTEKVGTTSPTQNLFSEFFLSVGEEVYESRKWILEQLKAHPQGDKYLKMLMESLAWFERGDNRISKAHTPPYNRYPQTIEQAEKFFLVSTGQKQSQDQVDPQSQMLIGSILAGVKHHIP